MYTSPGNQNDCEFRAAMGNDTGIEDGFTANEPAALIMFLEIPTSLASFNAAGDRLKASIAAVASVGGADKVKFNKVVEYAMADVNKLDDLASCCTGSIKTCCWERRRAFSSDAYPEGAERTGRHLLATNVSITPTPTPTEGECTPEPDTSGTEQCSENACTSLGSGDAAATQNLFDCYANPENNEDYSCKEGYWFSLTGQSKVTDDGLLMKQYECCKGGKTFVVVEVEVQTTLEKVDTTWSNMNEYDLNFNNAKSCLPPVVMTYEAIAGEVVGLASSSKVAGNYFVSIVIAIVLVLSNVEY